MRERIEDITAVREINRLDEGNVGFFDALGENACD
jgi:hypothetical protein